MPRHQKRVLDLSAATTEIARNTARQLSDKQFADYQSALASKQRWLSKLRRASNALSKLETKITRYERLQKGASK